METDFEKVYVIQCTRDYAQEDRSFPAMYGNRLLADEKTDGLKPAYDGTS